MEVRSMAEVLYPELSYAVQGAFSIFIHNFGDSICQKKDGNERCFSH